MLRVVMTAVQNTPKLLECDRTSLYAAVTTCAQLGLEPDGVLGQAYLVPFKGRVQFIPGYKGYLTLARNSGEVSSIQAYAVREGDEFSYSYGLEEHLHHVPAEDNEDSPITHFYAYAKFKDGGHVFEVLTRAKVDRIRDKSEGYQAFKANKIKSNPWHDHYEQMGRKTAIRRLANYLPMSVQRAAALDAAYDAGKHARTDDFGDVVIEGEVHEVEPEQAENGADKVASKLDALAGEDEQQPPAKPEEKPEEKPAPEAKNGRVRRTTEALRNSKRFVVENGELVDNATGEIVPERYIQRLDDGSLALDEDGYRKYVETDEKPTQQQATRSLFGAEG